jgi:hypothetical protein
MLICDHYKHLDLIITKTGVNMIALKKNLPLLEENIYLGNELIKPGRVINHIYCSYEGKNYFSMQTKEPFYNAYLGLIQTESFEGLKVQFVVFDIFNKNDPFNLYTPDFENVGNYSKILVAFFYHNNSLFRINNDGHMLANDCYKVK